MSLLAGSRHVGDDDLIRYIDHQLDRDAMRDAGVHLRTCAECAGRLDGFRRTSETVSEWLGSLADDAPDPARKAAALAAVDRARFRRRSLVASAPRWLQAAAAAVLLLGIGLATEPGRALVARGIVRVAGTDPGPVATTLVQWLGEDRMLQRPTLAANAARQETAGAAAPAPAAPALSQAPAGTRAVRVKPGTSAAVRFVPAGPDVVLRFDVAQSVGVATLWIRDVQDGSGQAVTHYGGEEIAATGDGLAVHNRRASRADYMITVPTRYRFVRVRVGDSPEVQIRISKAKQDWIWTINLQNSALQQ
jgi:anti-sigma factor RsiW